MSDSEYEQWWRLHLRVARDETLTAAERQEYEAGIALLDQEDDGLQVTDSARLRLLRQQIDQLLLVHKRLQAKSAELDRQIYELESRYYSTTGQVLMEASYGAS